MKGPPPSLLSGRVLRRAELLALGVTTRRLSSPEFVRVLPGCFTPSAAPASLTTVAAFVQRNIVPGSAFGLTTAAELLGLPLPREHEWISGAPCHVLVPPEARRTSAHRVTMHVRSRLRTVQVGTVRVSHPIWTLVDLATMLPHDDLVACIDVLSSHRRKEFWVPVETVRVAARASSAPGSRALRKAARDARDGTDSPRETRTRLLLTRAGYPEPEVNRPFVDPDTTITYWADFAYERWRIAIEYDGESHFTREQMIRDRHKDAVLHLHGWEVVRLTAEDHRDPANFLARLDGMISRAEARATAEGSAP